MRIFSAVIVSVAAGVLLWWFAAIVGTAVFSGMGIPDHASLIPGFLYTYVTMGTYFAFTLGYIGLPVCIGIAAIVAVVLDRRWRRGRSRSDRQVWTAHS